MKEGIGSYIYTKLPKRINPDIFVNKKYSKIKYESKAYYITQRVLYPDKDIIKIKRSAKRMMSAEKKLEYDNKKGIFKSFIDKTPINFPNKKRKNINRSFDNIPKENDIFLRNKNIENSVERIFGVERKKISKNHNYESDIPRFKFSRRLFLDKSINAKNIFL